MGERLCRMNTARICNRRIDEGNEHQFELLDAIETDDGRYVALLPVYDDADESVNDDGELIILEVAEENGEDLLVPIEDDAVFDEIAEIFEERLVRPVRGRGTGIPGRRGAS